MPQPFVYRASLPLGSTVEIVAGEDVGFDYQERLKVDDTTDLIVLSLSSTDDTPLSSYENIRINLRAPDSHYETNPEQQFYVKNETLVYAIIVDPVPGDYFLEIHAYDAPPFAVHFAAANTSAVRALASATTTKAPFKCRACQTIAKALALAIVASVAVAAIPAAYLQP